VGWKAELAKRKESKGRRVGGRALPRLGCHTATPLGSASFSHFSSLIDQFLQIFPMIWLPAVQRGRTNTRRTSLPLFCHPFEKIYDLGSVLGTSPK
jgi:hypothetical protein